MPAEVTVIPCLVDNLAYMLRCTETNEAVVIDASEDVAVMRTIELAQADLKAIWSTHHHGDHTGGNASLAVEYSCDVLGHHSRKIPAQTGVFHEGDILRFGRCEAEVLYSPGHTLSSVSFLVRDSSLAGETCVVAFTGDTILPAGCGRIFEGDREMMYRSLYQVLDLESETRICGGHDYVQEYLDFTLEVEPENERARQRQRDADQRTMAGEPNTAATLELERATNIFLRLNQTRVQDAIRLRWSTDAVDPAQLLELLRNWKNEHYEAGDWR